MRQQTDIIYAERQGGPLALDLFLPDGPASGLVLHAHGGGFAKGSRNGGRTNALAERITAAGLAMAAADYRLNTPATELPDTIRKHVAQNRRRAAREGVQLANRLLGPAFEAARQDLGEAIGFLRRTQTQLGVTTPKIALMGISAGGIAGLALAHPPDNLSDCPRPDAVLGLGTALAHPWALTANGPPVLLIHSRMDRIIPPSNAGIANKAAQDAAAPLSVLTCARRGHNAPVQALLEDTAADGVLYWDHALALFTRAGLISPSP